MAVLWRIVRGLPLALAAPVVSVVAAVTLVVLDVLWFLFGRTKLRPDTRPRNTAATVVIPNWNGRDLLEKYLPSVVAAAAGNPENEVLVVDNGSSDGSAEFVQAAFPTVRLVELKENLGFGGGSNRGLEEARNDIVVLLNSDMRVAPDFLQPLLDGFSDERVFAVACQIFFSDPAKVREETGLTRGAWSHGGLRVRHEIDPDVTELFPCFYGGGGSCAFDRRKFLELGGFDHLFKPFYLEDTDLGYLAWKRGWKVLYQPASHVWHEHRGTIGRKFSAAYIEGVIQKNFLLFVWKNIHAPGWIASHHGFALLGAWVSWLAGDSRERCSASGLARAFLQLPAACRSRWRSRTLAAVEDREAFRRHMAGFFRDRFDDLREIPDRLRVLFVSPYAVAPPIHGGAVFMNQTLRELGRHTELHLVALLDSPKEADAHAELIGSCASQSFEVRRPGRRTRFGVLQPFAVREFADPDLEWRIHRQIYQKKIDILQIEYTHMAQYAQGFQRLTLAMFEHDVYFQSIGRRIASLGSPWAKAKAAFEYLRALRFELQVLGGLDLIETCTDENREYLLSFRPELAPRMSSEFRAGIDPSRYEYQTSGREPSTVLFLGSFRHAPNLEALNWFLSRAMPHLVQLHPSVRVIIVGSEPPPAHTLPYEGPEIEMAGFVPDVREPLSRCAVFVCPILSGSGVRVKLLEAFAAGIPTVSTRLGAEGLTTASGDLCLLADDPREFAQSVATLLKNPDQGREMAARAREYVTRRRDIRLMTERLVARYRELTEEKRAIS